MSGDRRVRRGQRGETCLFCFRGGWELRTDPSLFLAHEAVGVLEDDEEGDEDEEEEDDLDFFSLDFDLRSIAYSARQDVANGFLVSL